jgi:transcriptional regulator with XRE-family HTH domain
LEKIKIMTAAELKTLREALGLPVAWVAVKSGVQRRTVEYWEAGRMRVPEDVAALLTTLDRQFDRAADEALAVAHEQRDKHGQPETVELKRYRTDEALWTARPDMAGLPVTAHAALLNRARRLLGAAGFAVSIQYHDT